MGTRALVIGLDGAEWSVVRRLQSEGKLPNLTRLIEDGAHGPLNSTTPPMTLPSWSSMLTGCHPGTHGIFDFVHRDSDRVDWRLEFTNSTHRAVPTIHEWLSLCGKRVASIAVPTTWPPSPVNGVMVSGFDSPVSTGIDGSFCHPPELYAELQERFGGLNFADFQETSIDDAWLHEARRLLLKEVERKEAIGKWLLERDDWDCFMLLFGESDTASHHFWRFFDASSPRFDGTVDEAIRSTISDVYERLDQAVGSLMESADAEVVCICSDHGFGGAGDYALYLNQFLISKGWLTLTEGQETRLGKVMDWSRRVGLSQIPSRLQGGLFRALPSGLKSKLETSSRFGNVDFQNTIALSDEMNYAATIRLNTATFHKSDLESTIEALRLDLLSWDVDGHHPVKSVQYREDVYNGAMVHKSPELILELNLREGYSYTLLPSIRAGKQETWRRLSPDEYQGGKGLGMNGSHRQFGVLIVSGEAIESQEITAEMADIAPTLLYILGEPIPSYMEGRVLDVLHTPMSVSTVEYHPISRSDKENSTAEHDAIHRRLEQLGYL